MNNKFDKDIRVYNKLRVFKESSYFYSSFKDTFSKVVRVFGSKQAFFDQQNAFPVLKSSRILCRHTDTDNNKDIDIARSKKKMDLRSMAIKMPISLQHFKKTTMIALSLPLPKMMMMPLFKLATPTQPSKHGRPTILNYY
jgi:hypothetical protein